MKVSVLIITYNQAPFIRQTLEGVIAQRVNFDFEIIVGEDNSTDGTREVVKEFYDRYPERIVPLLHNQNIGMMRNFKATLESCRGQYLAIVEGDDYWTSEDKLQRQVNFLDQHSDYALCFHRVEILDETNSGRTGVLPSEVRAGSYTIEDIIARNLISTCSVMYRRSSIGPLPDCFLDLKMGDWPLHILVARSGKIMLMDEVMAVYRVHSGGIWTSKSPLEQIKGEIGMFTAVQRHLRFQDTRAISSALKKRYFELAVMERRNGNRRATIKNVVACLRYWNLRLPGRFIDWAALLGYGILGIKRFRWWQH